MQVFHERYLSVVFQDKFNKARGSVWFSPFVGCRFIVTKKTIIVILFFFLVLSPTLKSDDVSKFVRANATNVESLWSIHSNFQIEVTNVKHPKARDSYTVEYFAERSQERWITRRAGKQSIGGFTALKYDIGIEDVSNGVSGFCRVNAFDGTIDSASGLLPVDSPASVVLAARASGKLAFLARLHMGLEILGEPTSRPVALTEFFRSSLDQNAEAIDTMVVLNCSTTDGKLEVVLDPQFGYAIKSYRFLANSGEAMRFSYSDFHKHDVLFLPHAFEQRFGELRGVGKIEYKSVNRKLDDEQLKAYMPSGIPFHDRTKDIAGIWGKSVPLIVFSSNTEAKNWDTDRKKQFVNDSKLRKSLYLRNVVFFLLMTVVTTVLALYFRSRKR